ncbi:ABC transporter ATP-binding protein [Aggregicoccus sp. 17bor-14]|uniref:ABC transporter ATP-binding protein n=1 Tax=Myxococcaceae TaxID=31 RepID=UPI00129D0F38|nr:MULTISPECIES: ABC transporter ATP-binding protein [Myxococcaceae]MBF5040837.1 ABC transporter ATP-binding protein [Simulacricoccus sp. 17bor-14]MRI86626.1 ABC transporter ATP-binding protein [Aggregicoccus sp. 17bor-14]
MIQVVDLHKAFGESHVLQGIDLQIPAGSTCVILGGSGSGKTVLMKHMIGLLKPDSGQMIIDGEDIVPMGVDALERVRRKFGMVFQAAALFDSMNVYENVAFPLREHRRKMPEEQVRETVRAKLALMGLNNVEQKFPADLSGGMRKRVGLARAIVLDPKIVLYDEPTTGLDPITTDYVDEMILAAKRELGVTSVVISHDIASAFNVADQIAFLHKGHIVARGTPEQMRENDHPAVKVFLQTWFGKN